MKSELKYVKHSRILVEGRIREDLGDIEGLADSIRENGLLQPLVVERLADNPDYDCALRCGGRRYSAISTLLNNYKVGTEDLVSQDFDLIPVTFFDSMPDYKRVQIELEENLRRKGMTWQENVLGILKFHKASKRAALLDGEKYSQAVTGELLNMEQASVSNALKVGEAMLRGHKGVLAAESMTDALKALLSEALDAAQAETMARLKKKRDEMVVTLPKLPTSLLVHSQEKPVNNPSPTVPTGITPEDVMSMFHLGDCLELLPQLPTFNHLICDPPYGIDMANLDNVERVADTHQVEDNLKLLPEFIRLAFDKTAEDGFLAMWYDLDHHEKIAEWAGKVGWRVQRWPFIWCKTTPCKNGQAQYNWTKSTEVCYLFRRSEHSILKQKQPNNYILAGSVATSDHPFVKPFEVWKRIIEAVSLEGQTFFDGFAGNGSSLAAGFRLGRLPTGAEIDPKHIAAGLSYVTGQVNQRSILDGLTVESPL